MRIGITGTGSYLPKLVTKNSDFLDHRFLSADGSDIAHSNAVIIEKFKAITGIHERRYAKAEYNTSDLGFFAAEKAIKDAGIDQEELDYIIFAHNFGDVTKGKIQGDTVPSLATRVKHLLKIKNPRCVAYDMLFGCPGWIEGVIQAKAFIQSGMAKKCLVIGGETLSRVIDAHDRDSMIYSDGAGACILEAESDAGEILNHASLTYAHEEAYFLGFEKTYDQEGCPNTRYIKMFGRKIYEFACKHVPQALADCLDESGFKIEDVKKILIHQANEKMDEAIIKRFYRIYNQEIPDGVMPMIIQKMGNNSVATVPILLDSIRQGKVADQSLESGDLIMFASVGAGMNINTILYRY